MTLRELGLHEVQTTPPSATVREAAIRMKQEGIGCLIVVEGKRPVGLVTDRDLALSVIGGKRDARTMHVGEIAVLRPVTLPITASVQEATRALRRHALRRLPVVDERGDLVGLVTQDDLLRVIATEVGELAEALRRQLSSDASPTARAR
ncbi:MAG TPA: CBS domain-containing protein [Myxococcota bacterium]|nr:CBS domain-containing protein [Myxococcota bacterium]